MKMRLEDLIKEWAARPDAFALEPDHIQKAHRSAVAEERKLLKVQAAEETAEETAEESASEKAKKGKKPAGDT